jgi:YrbI family 3-deoxy-D-manno-octulosonate 8-phosphate phosphatase
MRIAGVVPCKGRSDRIPSKNMQEVLGVPLFLWAANNLNRILPKNDIFIDSDSDEILAVAKNHGFRTIKRPASLATNATDGNKFMIWEAENIDAEIIIQHLPPMLFLKEKTLKTAIKAVQNGYDSAFACREESFYMWGSDGPLYDLKNIPNSPSLPKIIIEGMGLYVARKDMLLKHKTRICGKYQPISIDSFESIDIDFEEDLNIARLLAIGLERNSEYTEGVSRFVKLKPKMLVLDVDGVMTNGGMYYSESGDQYKRFNTKDGIAIKRLVKAGIIVRFLSSGTNEALIRSRGETLGVDDIYCGLEEKSKVLASWMADLGLATLDVAYIGDDINDYKAMNMCGIRACPSDASAEIKRISNVILAKKGGDACVREFVDEHLKFDAK